MPEPPPITENERIALTKFKERLSDLELDNKCLLEDRRLINWLRARDLKLNDAETMFRKHLDWRQENKIDTILKHGFTNIPEEALNMLPADIVGIDKDGNPILALFAGGFEIKKNVQKYGKKMALEVIHFYLEAAYNDICIISTNPNILKQADYIVDIEALRFKDYLSSDVVYLLITIMKEIEANYPELLKKAYVLNTPSIFPVLWNILKPFMSQNTINKVHVCNSNLDKFRSILLEQIPENQLPIRWGGTGYSGRLSQLNRHSFTSSTSTLFEQNFKEITVLAGETFELLFEVETPKALLSWSFKTKNYDIGLSVLYKPFSASAGDHEEKEVIKYKRFNVQKSVQNGSFICEDSGQYIIRFDNTYSRLRSK